MIILTDLIIVYIANDQFDPAININRAGEYLSDDTFIKICKDSK